MSPPRGPWGLGEKGVNAGAGRVTEGHGADKALKSLAGRRAEGGPVAAGGRVASGSRSEQVHTLREQRHQREEKLRTDSASQGPGG